MLDLLPEVDEAPEEIAVLLLEQGEAIAIAGAVGFGGGGPGDLLGRVKALEGKDGQAVEHGTGCLGVQRGGSGLQTGGTEQVLVDLLDEIVAALVEGINGMFNTGDLGVGGGGVAGAVFLVPEIEVRVVVSLDKCGETIFRRRLRCGGGVPEPGPMQLGGGEVLEGLAEVETGGRDGCGHECHCSS